VQEEISCACQHSCPCRWIWQYPGDCNGPEHRRKNHDESTLSIGSPPARHKRKHSTLIFRAVLWQVF
jgi:hypothetical protein